MTYETSKGHVVQSDLTDAQAAQVLISAHATGFAAKLAAAVVLGRLTENQRPWLHKLAQERLNGTAQSAAPQPLAGVDLSGIAALLKRGGAKLRFPKLTLDRNGIRVRLQVAGPKSKYHGDVMITDGVKYPHSVWYGRVTAKGELVPTREMTPAVETWLRELAADPAGFAAQYGALTGNCCFCNRKLVTPESLAAGYGPVCAENFGLPW